MVSQRDGNLPLAQLAPGGWQHPCSRCECHAASPSSHLSCTPPEKRRPAPPIPTEMSIYIGLLSRLHPQSLLAQALVSRGRLDGAGLGLLCTLPCSTESNLLPPVGAVRRQPMHACSDLPLPMLVAVHRRPSFLPAPCKARHSRSSRCPPRSSSVSQRHSCTISLL